MKAIIPEIDDLISDMEAQNGWLVFNDNFISTITNLGLKWWEFYEDETKLRTLGLLMLLDEVQLEDVEAPENLDKLKEELTATFASDQELSLPTEEEQQEWVDKFQQATPEEQQKLFRPVVTY